MKPMKKVVSVLVVCALALTVLAGCGTTQQKTSSDTTYKGKQITIKMAVPKAPPTLPILHMMDKKMLGKNVKFDLDIWTGTDQLVSMTQDGEHDMYAFPLPTVAVLYNKGLDVRLMNVSSWGVTYFMSTDKNFKTWSDLKGKTVYVPLKGAAPDILTQYFIKKAGLDPQKDVNIVYSTYPEIATMLASGEAEYATEIEPQVTAAMMKNKNVRRALSFEKEWQKDQNSKNRIPNAGWGTTQSFIDAHPALTKKFQKAYQESVAWTNAHPKAAGKLAEKYLQLDATLIEKSIPHMGLYYKSAAASKSELDEFYNLLNDFNSEMLGGKIPDKGMYYSAK